MVPRKSRITLLYTDRLSSTPQHRRPASPPQDIENGYQDPTKKKTLAVFFDLTKAFDRVWKKGLLLKVMKMGIRGKMLNWIKNFLHIELQESAWMDAQAT